MDIKDFLEKFSYSIEQENLSLYKRIMEESCLGGKFDDFESFYLSVIYPFENFINSFVKSEISDSPDVMFLMRHSQFVEGHFRTIIEHREGLSCCADKSRTIMRGLIRFYAEGIRIAFDYNGKYTFHLPKEVFTSHDEIVEFYSSLKMLYYGNGDTYVKIMNGMSHG